MTSEERRTTHVAEFVLAYAGAMSGGDRIKLAISFYDRAHHDGVMQGVDELKDRLLQAPTLIPLQAG